MDFKNMKYTHKNDNAPFVLHSLFFIIFRGFGRRYSLCRKQKKIACYSKMQSLRPIKGLLFLFISWLRLTTHEKKKHVMLEL